VQELVGQRGEGLIFEGGSLSGQYGTMTSDGQSSYRNYRMARPIYTLVTKGSHCCLFCLSRSEEGRDGQANVAKTLEQNVLTESPTMHISNGVLLATYRIAGGSNFHGSRFNFRGRTRPCSLYTV
jgi:hypothetical protein